MFDLAPVSFLLSPFLLPRKRERSSPADHFCISEQTAQTLPLILTLWSLTSLQKWAVQRSGEAVQQQLLLLAKITMDGECSNLSAYGQKYVAAPCFVISLNLRGPGSLYRCLTGLQKWTCISIDLASRSSSYDHAPSPNLARVLGIRPLTLNASYSYGVHLIPIMFI